MPRVKGKATKIAFKIIGVPANYQSKPKKKEKEVDKRLVFEETTRVR